MSRQTPFDSTLINLLIRCDDIGMCHSVNEAMMQLIASKIPFSASVLFPCPAFQEAIDILKQHPEVSVGVHLTLNAEWKNYRWGPVAGAANVPSLVDSDGFFFPSSAAFYNHQPKISEIETELRAQIERALNSGLAIDHIDTHMGTISSNYQVYQLAEHLAAEYKLPISGECGEQYVSPGIYSVPLAYKTDSLVSSIKNLRPGSVYLIVSHIGLETPEMNALVDFNPGGLTEIGKNRHAELLALTSSDFLQALSVYKVKLLTYRQYLSTIQNH
ncbi:MAG: ChbG/HpnK family deacetylase [Bacteroidota bacterium]